MGRVHNADIFSGSFGAVEFILSDCHSENSSLLEQMLGRGQGWYFGVVYFLLFSPSASETGIIAIRVLVLGRGMKCRGT